MSGFNVTKSKQTSGGKINQDTMKYRVPGYFHTGYREQKMQYHPGHYSVYKSLLTQLTITLSLIFINTMDSWTKTSLFTLAILIM